MREPCCALCGRPLIRPAPARNPAPPGQGHGSGPSLPDGFACGRCRRPRPAYDRLVAGWVYGPPLDAVIRGLKFRRLDHLGGHLGRHLARQVGGRLAVRPPSRSGPAGLPVVVPVPLHWRRRLARGFDQADLIARSLADALVLPAERLLLRRRPTPPQSGLERAARRRNLRGAFALRRRARVDGRRLLLVDDVFTSGATLEAAARALCRAGAAEVVAVVVARTPGADERAPAGAR